MEAQKRDHEEELVRCQQSNLRTSQEIVNQEALLQGNISQLQAQLLEAQAFAHNQCKAFTACFCYDLIVHFSFLLYFLRASPHFSRSHAACRERFANFRSRGQKP